MHRCKRIICLCLLTGVILITSCSSEDNGQSQIDDTEKLITEVTEETQEKVSRRDEEEQALLAAQRAQLGHDVVDRAQPVAGLEEAGDGAEVAAKATGTQPQGEVRRLKRRGVTGVRPETG